MPPLSPPVLFEVEDGIATITMNRPEAQNTFNMEMIHGMEQAWHEVRRNPDIRVAILTGAGDRFFQTGLDLTKRDSEDFRQFRAHIKEPPDGLVLNVGAYLKGIDVWKPIVVAINGHAVNTGIGMITASDYRIAADTASLAFMEVRLRQTAQVGTMARLPRQVPYAHAMMALLTGQRITAEEAFRIGLLNEVVPSAKLMPSARDVATTLRDRDPYDVQHSKQAAIRGLDVGLSQALVEEGLYQAMRRNRRRGR